MNKSEEVVLKDSLFLERRRSVKYHEKNSYRATLFEPYNRRPLFCYFSEGEFVDKGAWKIACVFRDKMMVGKL